MNIIVDNSDSVLLKRTRGVQNDYVLIIGGVAIYLSSNKLLEILATIKEREPL